jgi:hypothetical protein
MTVFCTTNDCCNKYESIHCPIILNQDVGANIFFREGRDNLITSESVLNRTLPGSIVKSASTYYSTTEDESPNGMVRCRFLREIWR